MQALRGLGYASAAARLEEESEIPLQSDAVNRLQDGILVGRWEECVALLRELRLESQDVYRNAKFLILQQKFLEALEEGSTGLALKVRHCFLQTFLTAIHQTFLAAFHPQSCSKSFSSWV